MYIFLKYILIQSQQKAWLKSKSIAVNCCAIKVFRVVLICDCLIGSYWSSLIEDLNLNSVLVLDIFSFLKKHTFPEGPRI